MEPVLKSILILDIVLICTLSLFRFIAKNLEINSLVGYRTKRAMQNEKNWKFAQEFSSKNWLLVIPLMLLAQTFYFFNKNLDIIFISMVVFVIYTIILIFITEHKLKNL